MRKLLITTLALSAALPLGACATSDPYGHGGYGYRDRDNSQLERAAAGAALGAAAGAAVGAAADGVGVGEGAAIGAAAGGVLGAVTHRDNDDYRTSGREMRWNRDDRGYCYYHNDRGERVYDYNVRC
jgi:phage tail tape-measure protein